MERKEIGDFRKSLLDISLNEMYDSKIVQELAKLYTSLGDFFTLIKVPKTSLRSIADPQDDDVIKKKEETLK